MVTEGLSREFDERAVVDSISFSLPAGTILGLIGPSGSGKTTVVRMLTGTLEASSGSVRVLGEDPRRFRRRTRERIGYMPQLFLLYPDLTAQENVTFVASLFGLFWRRRRRRVREVLQFVGLWDARNRRAKDLSGGMQRRLELACAMVHEPDVFFVDEPTAGLDPILRQTIWTEFRRLRDAGRTLLVTTQYVGEAEYCDQVAVLMEGRLIALAPPEQLRRAALGGEVLEVETEQAFDGAVLSTVDGVKRIRQRDARRLLVMVDDAGTAAPRVQQAITDCGVGVVASSEYRPTFDEVFAELVEREQNQEGSAEDAVNGAVASVP